jgi:hypothetical protein
LVRMTGATVSGPGPLSEVIVHALECSQTLFWR